MFVCSAKPRPSKKARLNKPSDDNVTIEPEKTPNPVKTNADAMLDDPPPQDHDFLAEQVEVDATGHADTSTSPARTDDKPASPAKAADKPSTPAEDAEAALKPVVDELTGVKRQIHAMTAAVFGKYPCFKFFNISSHTVPVY